MSYMYHDVLDQTVFIIIRVIFHLHFFFYFLNKSVALCLFLHFSLQSIFRKRWKKLFLSEGSVTLLQVKVILK